MSPSPEITPEEALFGIYLDFEGTAVDPASLLGVLSFDGEQTDFTQFVFEEDLWPAAAAAPPHKDGHTAPTEADFDVTMALLHDWATTEGLRLFAYSSRELGEITDRLTDETLAGWWESNLINVIPHAKRWKRRHHRDVEFPKSSYGMGGKNTLARYEELIGFDVPKAFGPGNSAQRIRSARSMLQKRDGDYERLTPVVKGKWTKALLHNWYDCEGLRQLVTVIAHDVPRIDAL